MWCFGLFKSVFCIFFSFKFGNSPLFLTFEVAKSAKKQFLNNLKINFKQLLNVSILL